MTDKTLIRSFWATVTILIFALFVILIIGGCVILPKKIPNPSETNTAGTIIKQVKVNDWLTTGSILIMGIGMFGFLKGVKDGLLIIIAAGFVLAISLILKAYGAIIVFASAVCLAGYIGWQIWIRIKALNEVVGNIEQIKEDVCSDEKEWQIKPILESQSNATKSVVAKIRWLQEKKRLSKKMQGSQ